MLAETLDVVIARELAEAWWSLRTVDSGAGVPGTNGS